MSVAGVHRLELEETGSDRFAGRLYMERPSDFMDVTFQYRATFDAPIVRAKAAQATSGGKNLDDTPQGKAARAFMKAVASGDLEAVRKMVSAEGRKELEGPDAEETFKMLQAFTPEKGEITAVEVKGNTASVTVVEKDESSTSTLTMKLVLENKEWKVSP
jgi:hypothetical protein